MKEIIWNKIFYYHISIFLLRKIIMATEKENVMQMIKELPNDITVEDIMYHVYAREKIICGLKDADEGKKVSNEKAKEVIEKWFE